MVVLGRTGQVPGLGEFVSSRAEWLELRRKGLGGSDVAGVLGLSPWSSPMSVWCDKMGLSEESEERNFRLDIGLRLEPVIADLYERETGRTLAPGPGIITHAKYPFLIGTPDRVVNMEPIGVELKTSARGDEFGAPGTDEVPEHYYLQCMHYMEILDFDTWDIALLRGGSEFSIYTIRRDDNFRSIWADVLPRLVEFWEKNVLDNVPPDVDGSEAWGLYLAKKHGANLLPVVDATEEAEILVRKLEAGLAKQRQLDAAVDAIKNQLKVLIGDYDGFRCDEGKVTWKKTKDGVDIDFEEAFTELLETHIHPDAQKRVCDEILSKHSEIRRGSRRFLFTANKEQKVLTTEAA